MENCIHFTLYDKRTGKSYSETLSDGDELSIGRLPKLGNKTLEVETALPLFTRCISRDHVKVVAMDFGTGLELHALDFASRNGSFVNGKSIEMTRPTLLKDGDTLGLGCGGNSHYDFLVKLKEGSYDLFLHPIAYLIFL